MASLSPRLYVILAKIEVTQFTDPVPTGAANAILCKNLKVTPLKVTSEDRAIMRPYYGNSEQIPVSEEAVLTFDVELAGSGTAGTAPKWAPLIRACGFAETLVAVTSAAYNPISAAFESVTIYAYRNGILYKFSGCRGNVKITMAAKKIPEMNYTFTGKYVAVSDAAMPTTPDYSGFLTPKASIPTWTGALTVNAYAALVSAFDFDVGNLVQHGFWINQESLDIMDRKPKGSITMQSTLIATNDVYTLVRNATLMVFTLTHGTIAGNKVKLDAPKMQLVDVNEVEFEGQLANQLTTAFMPNAGNDEFIVTCT